MKIYVSDGTWFDKHTIAILIDDYRVDNLAPTNAGLFFGTRTCKNSKAEAWKPVGTKYLDEEVCNFNEFEEIDVG